MRPCSPAPPMVLGLQILSWRAIAARRMGGTGGERLDVKSVHRGAKLEVELTSVLVTILLEGPNVVLAGIEGTTLSDGVVEVHGNQISYLDIGRVPSTVFDTTVQPIDGSIRTTGLGDLFCKRCRVGRKFCGRRSEGLTSSTTGSAPIILNIDDTTGVGSRVTVRRIIV